MVQVEYQNANYDHGNQSAAFFFEFDHETQKEGILIDCGPGVDFDRLLDEGEYLQAVLLTHLHLDHIQSLAKIAERETPIITTRDNEVLLDQMVKMDGHRLGIDDPEVVNELIRVVESEWEQIRDDLEVRAIPAGHAPGAVGFLIRFKDEGDWFHILATGDFTLHGVAGNPGFDPQLSGCLRMLDANSPIMSGELAASADEQLSIGALLINVSIREDALDDLERGLATIVDRASDGSATLVATSALASIHVAALLDAINGELDQRIPVVLVGKAAAYYRALGWDLDTVSAIEEYEDPAELLRRGQVTIAGPEDASNGSSKVLLDTANRSAGDTTVIQFRNAGSDPLPDTSWLTSYDFDYSMHPSEEDIDTLATTVEATQTLIGHTSDKRVLKAYRERGDDWGTFVWASYGHDRYEIFDGMWLSPQWINDEVHLEEVSGRSYTHLRTSVRGDLLPRLDREEVNLVSEGIDPGVFFDPDLRDELEIIHFDEITVDAGIAKLAEHAFDDDVGRLGESNNDLRQAVVKSIDWFIVESLRGPLPRTERVPSVGNSIGLVEGTPLHSLLAESKDDPETFLLHSVYERLGVSENGEVSLDIPTLAPRKAYLQAIIDHDRTEFESLDEVVEAAMFAYIQSQ